MKSIGNYAKPKIEIVFVACTKRIITWQLVRGIIPACFLKNIFGVNIQIMKKNNNKVLFKKLWNLHE
jgi:hypothetical protein